MFQWLFVYIEVAQRNSDQMTILCVTESDLVTLIQKLRQKWRVEKKLLSPDVLSKRMSKDAILDLILDSMLMNDETKALKLSMLQLDRRFRERLELQDKFTLTGGRFVRLMEGQDPDLVDFTTVIPETELTQKLLVNV